MDSKSSPSSYLDYRDDLRLRGNMDCSDIQIFVSAISVDVALRNRGFAASVVHVS